MKDASRAERSRAVGASAGLALGVVFAGALSGCGAGSTQAAASPAHQALPAVFAASSQRPFEEQLMETMAIMDRDMAAAAMGGGADHDFVTMMIPHHQGGIDMAKVLLVSGSDPELRRLAQAIITDQQNEIELMQLWLARHAASREAAR